MAFRRQKKASRTTLNISPTVVPQIAEVWLKPKPPDGKRKANKRKRPQEETPAALTWFSVSQHTYLR